MNDREFPLSKETKLENALRYLGDKWLLARPINAPTVSRASIRTIKEIKEKGTAR